MSLAIAARTQRQRQKMVRAVSLDAEAARQQGKKPLQRPVIFRAQSMDAEATAQRDPAAAAAAAATKRLLNAAAPQPPAELKTGKSGGWVAEDKPKPDDSAPKPKPTPTPPKEEARKKKARRRAKMVRTESLELKLGHYEDTREKLDSLAQATGVRTDNATDAAKIQVGEDCEVFSESAGTYVKAKVVQLSDADDTDAEKSSEVLVQYEGTGGQLRQRWVSVTSTEFKRAAGGEDQNRGVPKLSAAAERKHQKERQRHRLGPTEKARARGVLMRMPETRKPDSLKEVVAWTHSVDIFYGLTESQRRELCMDVSQGQIAETTVMSVGDDAPGIYVIISGECAIYTMRRMELDSDNGKADLRGKFQKMQRRASVAIRQDSVVNQKGEYTLGPTTSMADRRRSIALAMVPGAQSLEDTDGQQGMPLTLETGEGQAPRKPAPGGMSLSRTHSGTEDDSLAGRVEKRRGKMAADAIKQEEAKVRPASPLCQGPFASRLTLFALCFAAGGRRRLDVPCPDDLR